MLLAKFQAFEMSNARYEATNRGDQLEMEEVTFEFERSSVLCSK
jgi:hypothetical protein